MQASARAAWKQALSAKIKRVTGRPPTDVGIVCCDEHGNALIYIGLGGSSSHPIIFNSAPSGTARIEQPVLDLVARIEDRIQKDVFAGRADEDDTAGYALSKEDPQLRAQQLELRHYALARERAVIAVLSQSSDARQRAVAALVLGYARQTSKQVSALSRAAFDPDAGVRNNAMRALGVLLRARPELGRSVEWNRLADLLASDHWTDRNKASFLFLSLTATRDPRLLKTLRARVLPALIEMSAWPYGHALPARIILGRIAGLKEKRVLDLSRADRMRPILNAIHAMGSD